MGRRAEPPPTSVVGRGSELDRLLAAAAEEHGRGRDVVLATVVERRGSSYRGPGARLLVRADGTSVGLISGGCLEADVVERARDVRETGDTRVVTFDLTADDEAIWGWGLGCNGAIDVLVQSSVSSRATLDSLRRAHGSRRDHVITVALDGPAIGGHLLVPATGSPQGTIAADTEAIVAAGREQLERGSPARRVVAGIDLFLDVLRRPISLVICGAGPDVEPVVHIASELGWSVTVTDDRSGRFEPDRFGGHVRTVATDPVQLDENVTLDDRTYAVIMSHDFLRDAAYLSALAGTDVAYIGLLGPARRRRRLRDRLERDGVKLTAADLHKFYGPAGLDLGADGPVEIGWSICSEVLAVSRGRRGGHLGRSETAFGSGA